MKANKKQKTTIAVLAIALLATQGATLHHNNVLANNLKEKEAALEEISIEVKSLETEVASLQEEIIIKEEEINSYDKTREMPVCANNARKPFMDYRAITNTSSKQYELQQLAHTGDYGLRKYKGYYLVAMGTRYATAIGDRYLLVLENGTSIPVMIGDIKQDIHTKDGAGCVGADNGDIVEFIFDGQSPNVPSKVRAMGSYDAGPFPTSVVKIIKL